MKLSAPIKRLLLSLYSDYSKSLTALGKNKVHQNFSIDINPDTLPEFYEGVTKTGLLNSQLMELEDGKYIQVKRNRYDNNMPMKVTLISDPEKIYELENLLGLEHPGIEASKLKNELQKYSSSEDPVVQKYVSSLLTDLEDQRKLAVVRNRFGNDLRELEDIIHCIEAIDKLDGVIRERDFSIQVLGTSKRFSALRSKINSIYVRFSDTPYETGDDAARILGVIHNPTAVYLKGNLQYSIQGSVVNGSSFPDYFVMSDETIEKAMDFKLGAKRVITVENLTTFYDFDDPDALIVYLAGYQDIVKEQLLKKIYEVSQDVPYFHWSDIDSGGFYIFRHLVKGTGIPFSPLLMNVATLKARKESWLELTAEDRKRLRLQRESSDFTLFHRTIDFMLENNAKLEQENLDDLSLQEMKEMNNEE